MDDDVDTDKRAPHDSGVPVSLEELKSWGVLYWKFNQADYLDENNVASLKAGTDLMELCKERSYVNHDILVISPSTLPNYEQKLQMFYTEHIHEDEEIR